MVAPDFLQPRLELLSAEYVLVQAWKKTASYIRQHNWYSDTLELDRSSVNLPHFLSTIAQELKEPHNWNSDQLRIVPAPKTQKWQVTAKTGRWEPFDNKQTAKKIRPLAHVSLRDQIVSTAAMLCLADRVETIQGDTRGSVSSAETRRRVLSYGNRLFCDFQHGQLLHRWGSAKLYRAYYTDYRTFLSRPEVYAKSAENDKAYRLLVVHSDLSRFYDRVRPQLLAEKLRNLKRPGDDDSFFLFTDRLFNWGWNRKDSDEVRRYGETVGISDFSAIALPQGLVSAGFFANVVLLDFDEALRTLFSQTIAPGIRLEDCCRYVDDLRIVLLVDRTLTLQDVEQTVTSWLAGLIERHAHGLQISSEKTTAATLYGDERPVVRQSRKMARIQSGVSGGFDAVAGEEILDAVQGLIRSQRRYSTDDSEQRNWAFAPIPDVRDETVARFAAGRFRSTYRSLRPLLDDRSDSTDIEMIDEENSGRKASQHFRARRSQRELDEEAKTFALGLIENWIEDPSNVRLLRIGLDIWPGKDILDNVLGLLRSVLSESGRGPAQRRIAWYCLAELFRAGATETGLVKDEEAFPGSVDLNAYRQTLQAEAIRLINLQRNSIPWYVQQQVLLFVATYGETADAFSHAHGTAETKHYLELIRFLDGKRINTNTANFSTLAILSRRSFLSCAEAVERVGPKLNTACIEQIAEWDPSFGLELLSQQPKFNSKLSPRLRSDLCLESVADRSDLKTLAGIVLQEKSRNMLRNEIAMLQFASQCLNLLAALAGQVVTPSDVYVAFQGQSTPTDDIKVKITPSRITAGRSLYNLPNWANSSEHWRFQLGYLLRFILTASQDFTCVVQKYSWKEEERRHSYRPARSHWYQRLYGFYNGHSGFGDDWLPISEWVEHWIASLLSWPGCRPQLELDCGRTPEEARSIVEARLAALKARRSGSNLLLLPLNAPRFLDDQCPRPLRVCVIQTVVPTPTDFKASGLLADDPILRKRHRNHLSAALAAVERMLDLRETHTGRDGRLDWLILPELSVHPQDVKSHLIPFARAHKTVILAGLTYERLFPGEPLINSAIWIIPTWSAAHGVQMLVRRQGKKHLAFEEESHNTPTNIQVQGFRPCQWLVGYEWSKVEGDSPLWLTASICYDATDISLAADLRNQSDVFAIPALNQDVGTFDQMALALHYHMYQLVIVANNGTYGGSNAYIPYREPYLKQVFHLHGQPQASVAFLEIDDIGAYLSRRKNGTKVTQGQSAGLGTLKYPPAGIK
jgi:hypothetical protein